MQAIGEISVLSVALTLLQIEPSPFFSCRSNTFRHVQNHSNLRREIIFSTFQLRQNGRQYILFLAVPLIRANTVYLFITL